MCTYVSFCCASKITEEGLPILARTVLHYIFRQLLNKLVQTEALSVVEPLFKLKNV